MYKKLDKKEKEEFVKKYFFEWGDDIRSVSLVKHDGINEYLINDAIIFLEK